MCTMAEQYTTVDDGIMVKAITGHDPHTLTVGFRMLSINIIGTQRSALEGFLCSAIYTKTF